MNPEFERNLWLEASPRRVAWAAVALGVIYVLAALGGGQSAGAMRAALGITGVGVAIVCGLIWGARAAGGSVLNEIGDRTWDFQRLSAVDPWSMTWGKLFGATSLAWLCTLSGLLVAGAALSNEGVADALRVSLHLGLGALLVQGVCMAAALVGVRKARAEGRTARSGGVAGGLAIGALILLGVASSEGVLYGTSLGDLSHLFSDRGDVAWWGLVAPASTVRIATIGAFAAWAFAGAWRLMRLELQMQNSPAVWCAFLAFLAVYVGGFAFVESGLAPACLAGAVACGLCAYATAFAEPADRVRLRRFFAAVGERAIARACQLAPAAVFPAAFAILLVLAAFLVAVATGVPIMEPSFLGGAEAQGELWRATGLIAFMARDLGIIAFHRFGPRPQRGDFGAVLTLALLYLAGGILGEIAGSDGKGLFVPLDEPAGLSLIGGAVQAVIAWWLAARRIRAPEVSAAPT